MTTHGKLKVKEKLYFYSNFSMNTFKDNQKFRKALKYFSVLTLMNLLYLNVFRPLKLSFDQLFLIVLAVVNVCNERGVDVYTFSPDQFPIVLAHCDKNSIARTTKCPPNVTLFANMIFRLIHNKVL